MLQGFFKWTRSNRDGQIISDHPSDGFVAEFIKKLDADQVLPWLDALIKHTGPVPPVLVGHVLGGAIAARFVIDLES